MLAPYVKNCTAIFNELANVPKIVLSPLSGSLTRGCSADPEHAPNRSEPDFRRTIISGMERLRKAIREQLLALGIRNYKVLNPLWLMGGAKSIDAALQGTIDQLWDSDPVHVTDGGNCKLVDSLDVAARHLLNSSGGQHWNANTPPPPNQEGGQSCCQPGPWHPTI